MKGWIGQMQISFYLLTERKTRQKAHQTLKRSSRENWENSFVIASQDWNKDFSVNLCAWVLFIFSQDNFKKRWKIFQLQSVKIAPSKSARFYLKTQDTKSHNGTTPIKGVHWTSDWAMQWFTILGNIDYIHTFFFPAWVYSYFYPVEWDSDIWTVIWSCMVV